MHISFLEPDSSLADVFCQVAELRADALVLSQYHQFDQAVEVLQQALSLDENNVDTLMYLGQLYNQQGNIPAAMSYMARAHITSIDERDDKRADPDISMSLGGLYMQSGQYRSAYRKFSEAREFDTHKKSALLAMNEANHAQMRDVPTFNVYEGVARTVSPDDFPPRVVVRHPRPSSY